MSIQLGPWLSISILSFNLLLLGCASGELIKNVNRPLRMLQDVASQTAPGGVRHVSTNQRVFTSKYFPPQGAWSKDAENESERAFAQIFILGDRRPYTVEVRAFVETKEGGDYRQTRAPELAQRVAQRYQSLLANRRKDRDLIDDFRPF